MILEEKNYTYRNLNIRYPNVVKEAIDIREDRYGDLLITMPDNSILLYNDVGQRLRRMPSDINNVSEEECLSEFGIRLLDIMRRDGVSQLELSERTGIPCPMLSNYMNGKTCPSFYKVDKIARALGCSVDDFRYC